MKPPICKVCKSPHWTYEAHKPTAALEEVRELGASVLRNTATRTVIVPPVSLQESNVPTVVPTTVCACGKPREGRYKSCSACRKALYRERNK